MSGGWERARHGLPVRRIDALVPCLAGGCGYSAYIRRIFRHLHADDQLRRFHAAVRTAGSAGERAFLRVSREAASEGRKHIRWSAVDDLVTSKGVAAGFHSGSMKLSQ